AYEFDASPQDVALLRNISRVSAAAHMPFIGAVGPAFFLKETMFDLITGLLEASLPSRVIALEMTRPDGQTWKANLHDIRLREEADLYLSVRSDIPAWQVAEKFPALCQAGSPDDVREIYGAALKGIPLIPVSRVPAALPVRMENQYFALDIESPAAHEMLEQGVCMFYVPELLGALELELFAVLRS
ncbi:type VI secretion system baseplate subunit TssK, partial [Klebsiella pneumoniae]